MAEPKAAWCKKFYWYAAEHLNLDVDLRYRAVARLLKEFVRPGTEVLEVGAGAITIGHYFRCRTVAVDPSFDEPEANHTNRIRGSATALPFSDRQWDVVCSVDMLEHIPPEVRYRAILESVRVARSLVVIAVPVGEAAYRHDVQTHEYYLSKHGIPHRFNAEHVELGLPSGSQVKEWIENAASELGRRVKIVERPNVNIRLRLWYMKLSLHPAILIRSLYVALYPLAYVGWTMDRGECYRRIYAAVLKECDAAA
jgi:hypothetical protein